MLQRLEYIDQLKGLAMLLVVIGHIIVFCGLGYENTFVKHITMMNMPLFFFLNGLVISELINYRDVIRKIHQILLPFFAWGILIVLYRNSTYSEFLSNYWKFGYWYLLVLFEFFVMQAVLSYINLLINIKKRWWIDIIIFIFLYQALRYAIHFIPADINCYIDYWQFIAYFPYFFLGGFIKRYHLTEKMLQYSSTVITTLLILLIPLYLFWLKDMYTMVINIALPLDIILLLFMIFSLLEKDKSNLNYRVSNLIALISVLLSVFGKHTLAIYMIQFFLFRYINLESVFLALYESNNYFAILFVSTLTAISLCYLCILCEYILCRSRILSYILLGRSWRK